MPDSLTCFKESWNQPSSHVTGRSGHNDGTRRFHGCFFWAVHTLLLIVMTRLVTGIVATRTEPMPVESNKAVPDSTDRGERWHSSDSRHRSPGPSDEAKDANYSVGSCRLLTTRLHDPD